MTKGGAAWSPLSDIAAEEALADGTTTNPSLSDLFTSCLEEATAWDWAVRVVAVEGLGVRG